MLRSQTRHSVQGTSQCYSDDGELHERVELRRRSIWIQDCQHQQGESSPLASLPTRPDLAFEMQLVDTKSSNGQNLLHFLEKTISTQFPEMQSFRKELEKPAEAYRGKTIG